jgi:hypothetical protein
MGVIVVFGNMQNNMFVCGKPAVYIGNGEKTLHGRLTPKKSDIITTRQKPR